MTALPSFREGVRNTKKDEFIARLHAEAPIYKDDTGFWVVSRFDDVREVLLDHKRFSSRTMGGGFPLLSDDPPRHSGLRSLISKAFSPGRIDGMRPEIEAIAQRLVAQIEPGKDSDIVAALTSPLPVTVIARMLGVPEADNARFKRWSDAIVGLMGDPMGGERLATIMELRNYFAEVLAARRQQPGADLISALLRSEEAGASLSDEEVVGFAILLLIAGNETTTNLLGNLLNRLATAPEDWTALRSDPAQVEAAIEETLRADSPAQFVMRNVREDTELAGHALKQNEMVMVYLAAANRDPSIWSDPANFELARERERHLAFGYGVHTCIGAPLARLEARAAMNALVERFASMRHGQERGRRLPSGILYGFRTLPLVFG